ncbi:hypothetical protein OO184_12955 [Photorhabdus sp. APURE]|uniref:hypothetical protein n=1 Tax=Photorhabdus aballayi TaxID=2991723 RepID=UPI00223DA779|nr:hypothetical protein [Photorhabdus aballayi]MCW7548816.1 hypothetical protein [Photorhabdus aballayi]
MGKKSDVMLTLEEKTSEKTGFKLIKQSGKNDSVNPITRIYLIKTFNRINRIKPTCLNKIFFLTVKSLRKIRGYHFRKSRGI